MIGVEAQIDTINGQQVTKCHFGGTSYASPGLRPGHVMIGGIETTIESAIAAGFITREEAQKGFQEPVQSAAKPGIEAGEQKQEAGDPELSQDAQAAKEASDTLNSLDQTIGAQVVDAALAEVAAGRRRTPRGGQHGPSHQGVGRLCCAGQHYACGRRCVRADVDGALHR
jgi:hypothetical protein